MKQLSYLYWAALAIFASPLLMAGNTVTNSPTAVANDIAGGFDIGATTGLSILGFLMILGAVITGIKVYRRR